MNITTIENWREICGLSRTELAQRASVPPALIARLERGDKKIMLDQALRLAAVFAEYMRIPEERVLYLLARRISE